MFRVIQHCCNKPSGIRFFSTLSSHSIKQTRETIDNLRPIVATLVKEAFEPHTTNIASFATKEDLKASEKKLESQIEAVEKKLERQIDAVDKKLDTQFSSLEKKIEKSEERTRSEFRWLISTILGLSGTAVALQKAGFFKESASMPLFTSNTPPPTAPCTPTAPVSRAN